MKLTALLILFILAVFSGCPTSSSDKEDDTNNNNGNDGYNKVSGYVKLTSVDGTGIKGVAVNLTQSGPNVYIMSTNSDGYFEFVNVAKGSYTITFTMTGYSFNPPTITKLNVSDKDVIIQTIVGTHTGGNT
jgi:hypothetical protein